MYSFQCKSVESKTNIKFFNLNKIWSMQHAAGSENKTNHKELERNLDLALAS